MTVRAAAAADVPAILELYRAFFEEQPPEPYETEGLDAELREVEEIARDHLALVAEDERGVAGFALARRKAPGLVYLSDLYVRPEARRSGVARRLVAAVAEAAAELGATHVSLHVTPRNAAARALYERLGFRIESYALVAEAAALTGGAAADGGRTFGSVHVQSDDAAAVERAVREFVPRLPGRSRGSLVSPARNGWVAVHDDVCDRDPRQLHRLARELSQRLAAVTVAIGLEEGAVVRFVLVERGSVVDEYASLPEHHGPLPPGDVIALAANPRVVARLTGADPGRVRAVARQGRTATDLPPPDELLAEVAAMLGLTGAEHGWADAPDVPGAVRVDR